MSNKTINVEAKCPFFVSEAKMSITCEGLIGKEHLTRFDTKEEKVNHEKAYCTTFDFRDCALCGALWEGESYDR